MASEDNVQNAATTIIEEVIYLRWLVVAALIGATILFLTFYLYGKRLDDGGTNADH
jgi:predicted permease